MRILERIRKRIFAQDEYSWSNVEKVVYELSTRTAKIYIWDGGVEEVPEIEALQIVSYDSQVTVAPDKDKIIVYGAYLERLNVKIVGRDLLIKVAA